MSVRIKTVTKALPQYSRSTAEIVPFFKAWLNGQEERFAKKVIKIIENAAVDRRYSFLSPEEVFSNLLFEQRNEIYIKEGIKYGTQCLASALEKANWTPQDVDYIITVSCTGIMIPSLDA